MSVLSVNSLTKSYGIDKGVFDLSFYIEQGQVFGFLGPNGAGKTTTIRHLMGLLNADSGSCTINNLDCRTQSAAIQKNLGYLPGEIAFFDNMTGNEFLLFMANMRALRSLDKMHRLIELFELDPVGKIKKMSKGMKQKIGLVSAFMHNPDILILDEPTSGLDPLMQSKFIELICREKAEGKTILMSSHSFEEVERTCDRVGIIRRGRLVANETVSHLKAKQRKIYHVTFNSPTTAAAFAREATDVVSTLDCTVQVAVSGDINPFIAALGRYDVHALGLMSQSLEEIFMQYYGGEQK